MRGWRRPGGVPPAVGTGAVVTGSMTGSATGPGRCGARRGPAPPAGVLVTGLSLLSVVVTPTGPAAAQDPPPAMAEPPAAAARVAARVSGTLRRLGPELGPSIWPGFRPDTIPVRFVVPQHGALLGNWGRSLPDGYGRLEGAGLGWRPGAEPGAASTGGELGGRRVAQAVVREPAFPELFGLAVHEAFHVFAWSRREEGRWFGAGERSFLVSSYPVFDVENERGVILEGRLLREALAPSSEADRARVVDQFLAVRESRHRRIGHEMAEFEAEAEMNEGLAEYAQIRAREAAGRVVDDAPSLRRLENLAGDPDRSIRLRFYSTGPAMALLLDRIGPPDWKRELVMTENLNLQDALARAVGYRERERRLREKASDRHDGEVLARIADARVDSLGAMRRRRADEILSAPGLLVVVSMTEVGGSIGLCGYDPQNLLQGPDGLLLHTRWLRPCAGSALEGELSTPAVHDREAGTLAAVAGSEGEVRVTVGGREVGLADGEELRGAEDVVVESPRLTLRSTRADLVRRGRRLELIPLPN